APRPPRLEHPAPAGPARASGPHSRGRQPELARKCAAGEAVLGIEIRLRSQPKPGDRYRLGRGVALPSDGSRLGFPSGVLPARPIWYRSCTGAQLRNQGQSMSDVIVIGGGAVGLATALSLAEQHDQRVTVLEAESRLAAHQTGHNSGVIHS